MRILFIALLLGNLGVLNSRALASEKSSLIVGVYWDGLYPIFLATTLFSKFENPDGADIRSVFSTNGPLSASLGYRFEPFVLRVQGTPVGLMGKTFSVIMEHRRLFGKETGLHLGWTGRWWEVYGPCTSGDIFTCANKKREQMIFSGVGTELGKLRINFSVAFRISGKAEAITLDKNDVAIMTEMGWETSIW